MTTRTDPRTADPDLSGAGAPVPGPVTAAAAATTRDTGAGPRSSPAAPAPAPAPVPWAGALVAGLFGVAHVVPVPEYLADPDRAWIGVLFLLGGAGPVAAAVVMAVTALPPRLRRTAVQLTAAAAAVSIVMGVLSRTSGLPGLGQEPWDTFILISLALEATFLALTPTLLRHTSSR